MKFINLTGSSLYIQRYRREPLHVPVSGFAYVDKVLHREENTEGVQFFSHSYGQVHGLPEPDGDVIYIVSEELRKVVTHPGNRRRRDDCVSHGPWVEGSDKEVTGLVTEFDNDD